MANWWDNVANWTRDRKNNVEDEAKKYRDNFGNWINETTKDSKTPSINPADHSFRVHFGSDKTPLQFGFDGKFPTDPLILLLKGKNPLANISDVFGSGKFTGRVGGYGLEANLGANTPGEAQTAAKGKFPVGFNIIHPEWTDPDRAIRDPRWRRKFGSNFIGNILEPVGRPQSEDDAKSIKKRFQEEAKRKAEKNPIGGFIVPKGVLEANKGIYAAVLNGKQGFLDKSTGKWSEYGSLTPEQKSRLASDFINDPKQLAKALPQGSYSKQDLYLPEFQKVQAPK